MEYRYQKAVGWLVYLAFALFIAVPAHSFTIPHVTASDSDIARPAKTAADVGILDVTPADGDVSVGSPLGEGLVQINFTIALDGPIEIITDEDPSSTNFGKQVPNLSVTLAQNDVLGVIYDWNTAADTVWATIVADENAVYDYIVESYDNDGVGDEIPEGEVIVGTISTGADFPGASISGSFSVPSPTATLQVVFVLDSYPFSLSPDLMNPVRIATVTEGSYIARGLPEGSYYLVALAFNPSSFDEYTMPEVYWDWYNVDGDTYADPIDVVTDPVTGVDFSLMPASLDMLTDVAVVASSPGPLETGVVLDPTQHVVFSAPIANDPMTADPLVEGDIYPYSASPGSFSAADAAVVDDGHGLIWDYSLDADQPYQFVIWGAETYDEEYPEETQSLSRPVIIPFTTGSTLPAGRAEVTLTIPAGINPESDGYAVALLDTAPLNMDSDTWDIAWVGYDASTDVVVDHIPDGEYYVAAVPWAENLAAGLYMDGGVPATISIVGGSTVSGINIDLGQGVGGGVEIADPMPGQLNVSVEKTISITFSDTVAVDEFGDPEMEIMLFPSPEGQGSTYVQEDGNTLSLDVLLAADQTYQVFVVGNRDMPISYVFSTGSTLATSLVAGQLQIEASDFNFGSGDREIPQDVMQKITALEEDPNGGSGFGFAVVLTTQFPSTMSIESNFTGFTRVGVTLSGSFILQNVPAGDYYVLATTIGDDSDEFGNLIPDLFGFLDADGDALPDMISVGVDESVTDVEIGIDRILGWPRVLDASPALFETDVVSGEPTMITLHLSNDFEPRGDGSIGTVHLFPAPPSGVLSPQDFDLFQQEDGTWMAEATVQLAANTTYSLWIFDMWSTSGSFMFPMQHVFSTGSAIPDGRVEGSVEIPPLMYPAGDGGAFVLLSDTPGVPDLTALDLTDAFSSLASFGFLSYTGKYTVNYVADGTYYPTAMVNRDVDEVTGQPLVLDYGQPDADGDGAGDPLTISGPDARAALDITIDSRQARLRVESASPADGAVSVPTTTTLSYSFSEPVWGEVSMIDTVFIHPEPLSMSAYQGETTSDLGIDVELAANTTYHVLFPVGDTGTAFEQTFTTAPSFATGGISGEVYISSVVPTPEFTLVALLDAPAPSADPATWSIVRLTQTYAGDFSFENLGAGAYYPVAIAFIEGSDNPITSTGTPSAEIVTAGQTVTGVSVGIGAGSLDFPPTIEAFDAFVVKVHVVFAPGVEYTGYAPVVKARITDPNGNSTIDQVVVSWPNGADVFLSPAEDGDYQAVLPVQSNWSGGEFSIYAVDENENMSDVLYDDVPVVTLAAPTDVSPVSGATGVALTPVLDWESVGGSAAYLVHMSTVSPINIITPAQGLADFLDAENSVINFTDEFISNSEYPIPAGVLSPSTTYHWVVGAANSETDIDQVVISQPASFTTTAGTAVVDKTPPDIKGNPWVTGKTNETVTIGWTTEESADSRVLYGLGEGAYTDSVVISTRSYAHNVTVGDLNSNTRYYFAVASVDRAGNRSMKVLPEPVTTDAVSDNLPPNFVMNPASEGVGQTKATIKWETDEPTSGVITLVHLGGDTTVYEPSEKPAHSVEITGLAPSTRYVVTVLATDLSRNQSYGREHIFYTKATPDTRSPVAISGPVVIPQETTALVQWIADEPHTATVNIRTLAGKTPAGSYYQATAARSQNVSVSGLTPATEYEAVIALKDASDNVTNAAPIRFRTRGAADTTPPRFTKLPTIPYRSATRVVVSWETDEPSDSYLRVLQGGVEVRSVSNGAFVRKHVLVVTNLAAGGSYTLQVKSRDAAGNVGAFPTDAEIASGAARVAKAAGRGGATFSTSSTTDNTAPVITSSPVVTSTTASTFTVEWETDETANSVVHFDPTSGPSGKLSRSSAVNYTQSVTVSGATTTHSVTVTGLDPGEEYDFIVGSTDPDENGETNSTSKKITTLQTEDTTPPVISNGPSIIGQTDSRLTVRWYTDEPSNSVVRWRPAGTGDVQDEIVDPDLVTEHVVTVTNLSSSSDYDLDVTSKDLIGNTSNTASTTGTTDGAPDGTAPAFSDLKLTVDAQQAVVTWKTNEPADTWLDYGTSVAYGTVVSKTDFLTSHSLVLTNLSNSTQYYFQIASSDASGNIADSTGLTFTTLDAADTTPPTRVTGVSAEIGAYAVRITWPASVDSAEVAGYIVERSSGGAYAEIAGPLTSRTYTDNTVSLDTPYEYRILAKDVSALGNISEPSDTVSATPTALSAPGAPTAAMSDTMGLKPTLTVANAPVNSRAIAGYSFLVATDAAMTQVVATGSGVAPGVDSTSWAVPFELNHGLQYWWAAKAVDEAGFAGPLTPAVEFLADSTYGPNAIALTTFTATSNRAMVEVVWELSGTDVLGFHVERSTSDAFERMTETPIAGGPRYEWLDGSVIPGRTYDYRIVALLPDGGTQTFGPVSVTAALPTQVTLHQNAPNPFNPSTSIAYEVPSTGHVRLVIYNALGQEVRVLVNRMEGAGWYRATWDGLTSTGTPAASGLYIARLVVGPESGQHTPVEARAIKMLMVR